MKSQRPRYALGDRAEGVIERIVPGGFGLLRGPHGVVLVEQAAPGDHVAVEVVATRFGAARGVIIELIEPGPGRTEPPCVWYGQCGGCDFQHLAAAAQIEAKEQIVRDALERIGRVEIGTEIEAFAAPRSFGARCRVELHASDDRSEIGFYGRRTHSVVPIDRCIVSREEINQALPTIRNSAQPLPKSLHLLAGDGSLRSQPAYPPIAGGPHWMRIGGNDYLADPGSFFQSSIDLLPVLIDRVTDTSPGGALAWDLFCGAGLFTLPLAKQFERAVGVDVDPRTIANAAKSAERNAIHNARFAASAVVPWLTNRRRKDVQPTLVVVDPPRSGLERALAQHLATRPLERLTYVSCDPTTLARDLRELVRGDLRIVDIAIFDLFPQTHHVETVVRLAAS